MFRRSRGFFFKKKLVFVVDYGEVMFYSEMICLFIYLEKQHVAEFGTPWLCT